MRHALLFMFHHGDSRLPPPTSVSLRVLCGEFRLYTTLTASGILPRNFLTAAATSQSWSSRGDGRSGCRFQAIRYWRWPQIPRRPPPDASSPTHATGRVWARTLAPPGASARAARSIRCAPSLPVSPSHAAAPVASFPASTDWAYCCWLPPVAARCRWLTRPHGLPPGWRSEEHTSELQSPVHL